MARCLVTGHKGYIGTKLFAALQERGHEVAGIDFKDDLQKDVSKVLKENLDGRFHPAYEHFKPEYIFHMACLPRVVFSIEHPVETMQNNVIQTSCLLNFARKVKAKRVIYSGSSAVAACGGPYGTPYGLQKLVSEMECTLYSNLYGLDTVTLRYFNVYSRCQKTDGPYATVVANWMHSIRENINPFITGDGEQRRDMAHLEDVVSANIFAMEYDNKFEGRHFDVGTGDNLSLNEIKNIVLQHHPEVEFEYRDPREGDVLTSKANMAPLKELGWDPRIKIFDGIDRCFRKERKDEIV